MSSQLDCCSKQLLVTVLEDPLLLSSEELVVVSTPKLLMSVLILPEKLSKDSKKMTLQTQVSLLITLEIMSEILLVWEPIFLVHSLNQPALP